MASRFHEFRRVVTNLAVLDFETPDHRMRLRSVHPGVELDQVVEATGFELVIDDTVTESRQPTDDEKQALGAAQAEIDRLETALDGSVAT